MKRLAALLFAMSVMTGMVAVTAPAQAAEFHLTGTASSSRGDITSGQVQFYATCADYPSHPMLTTGLTGGTFEDDIESGTYLVLIKPSAGQGASQSWHNAQTTCAQATPVTVLGDATIDLTALPGSNVSGGVSTSLGTVTTATVTFYASCKAYRNDNHTAISEMTLGTYTVTVPNGDYYVIVSPDPGQPAVQSWHGAAANCAEATPVSITDDSTTKALTIVAGTQVSGEVFGYGVVESGTLSFFASCTSDDPTYAAINWGGYLTTLTPGTYYVRIDVDDETGALSSWNGRSSTCIGSTPITVSGVNDNEPIQASAGSVISGTVTSSNGAVSDGSVSLYADCTAYSQDRSAGSGSISGGAYRAVVDSDGTYLVRVNPGAGTGAVRSWHNNSTTCDSATVITVTDRGTEDLVAVAGFDLTGQVTSTNGQVTSGEVAFYPTCEAWTTCHSADSSDITAGQYAVTLSPGTYRVLITPDTGTAAVESWHDAKDSCADATEVTVNTNGTLDLVATPGSNITGSVTGTGEGTVFFYPTCEEYLDGEHTARGDFASGPYSVTVPDGSYRVRVRPNPGQSGIDSWHSAKTACAQATVVTVAGNGTIDVVVASGGTASGTVSSSNGPVDSGSLAFYESCDDYPSYSSATTDISGGSFSLPLRDGTYRVLIRPDIDTGAARSWHNAKATCANADTITVTGDTPGFALVTSAGWQVSGFVTQNGSSIGSSQVAFYDTCQDLVAGEPAAQADTIGGSYDTTLPSGTYLARIEKDYIDSSTSGWHNAKRSCATADEVTISGETESADLVMPPVYPVSGAVTSPATEIDGGWIEFFDSCQNHIDGVRLASSTFDNGRYAVNLPAGTYRALIHPDQGAAMSWHNAKAGCDQADTFTVAGSTTQNLGPARGVVVTGGVSSSNGPVDSGEVFFTDQCRRQIHDGYAATDSFTGTYRVNVLPGSYRVWIDPNRGTGAADSWHSAQRDCTLSSAVTVSSDGAVALLAAARTVAGPEPTPEPPVTPAPEPPVNPTPPPPAQPGTQSVKKPPAKLKKGKKVALAKKTQQGAKVTWKTSTKKTCTVKKYKVTAKKKGTCKLSAKAPAIPGYTALRKKYTIRVK